MAKNSKKEADNFAARIKQIKDEIEHEEAFFGSRLDAELRRIMNMTDEELDAERLEDELKLKEIRNKEQAEKLAAQAQQEALLQQQQLERLQQLAGIRDGAAKEAEKRVKKLADKQIQRVLKEK